MAINCKSCGIEAEKPESFLKVQRSFSNKEDHYCPTCWSQKEIREHSYSLWWTAFNGVIGALFAWFLPGKMLGWVMLNLFFFQLFCIAVILPHELGHATVARWVGFHVHRIFVGMGRAVWKGKLFGFDTEVGLVPVGGVAIVAPRELNGYRRKMFAIVLAGPAANLLLMILILPALEAGSLWSFSTVLWTCSPGAIFFYANLWVLYANLVPYTFAHPLGKFASDGNQILSLPFSKPEAAAEAHAAYFALQSGEHHTKGNLKEAREWFERGLSLYPNNNHLLVGKGLQLLQDNEFEAAREVFHRLLNQPGINPAFRAIVLNNIAYSNAMMGDPSLLEEADRFSKEALATMGTSPPIRGTRGAVLVELGRVDEAIPFLQESMQGNPSPVSQAENCCWLAIAEAKRGNLPQAEKHLAEARKLYPASQMLGRAERAMTEQVN